MNQYKKWLQNLLNSVKLQRGDFDNVSACKYTVPDYWDIGEVYERLIEDIYVDDEIEKGIWEIYHSWIDRHISNYNTDFYYQSRRVYSGMLSDWKKRYYSTEERNCLWVWG